MSASSPSRTGITDGEPLAAGAQLNGVFEIDVHLASGGMGEVYRAHSIQTGDVVAIKVIRAAFVDDETAISLFRKEAAALFNLHHEAIVRYFLFSIDPLSRRAYLAMEFVDGEPLSAALRRGPLPLDDVRRLGRRIAQGLDAAHRQGVIHRDVAPDNILLPKADVECAKLIDFGIAQSSQRGDETAIHVGFIGKYHYASPEQLGLFGGETSAKSDIYSLGLVLLEALRGVKTDAGSTLATAAQARRASPDLHTVDRRIRPLLAQMLQPDPARRLGSAQAVADALSDLPRAPPQRRGLLLAAALTAAALAALAVLAWPPGARRDETPSAAASAPAAPVGALGADAQGADAQGADAQGADAARPAADADAGVAQFLADFDAGPCFALTSIEAADKAAAIEGMGLSREPFDRLDAAFKERYGFEALIRARIVTRPQCPALDLFNRFRDGRRPHVALTASLLREGQKLAGAVADADGRTIEALLVDAQGAVVSVTAALTGTDEKTFSIELRPPARAMRPGLLVIVASARPLSFMQPAIRLDAQSLLAAASGEAAATKDAISVALRSFRVD